MDLAVLTRIKHWLMCHRHNHPVEAHLFDATLILWLMGWVGWVPAFLCEALWAAPACMLGMALPTLYVTWRLKAHRQQRLRCDWAVAI